MSSRQHTFRRSIAAVGSVALSIALLSALPADADDTGLAVIDVEVATPSSAAAEAVPKASGRHSPQSTRRAPSSSSSDFASGATRRAARLARFVSTGANPSAAYQMTRADVSQDLVGQRLTATVPFRSTPAADSYIYVFFGQWRGGECIRRALIAAGGNNADAAGTFYDGQENPTTSFAVSRSRSGSTVSISSAANSAFRTAEYDCSFALVAGPNGTPVHHGLGAESLITQFTPRLAIAGGEPLHAARPGKWVTMRLEVRNSGRADAANARITAVGKGLRITPRSRNLGTIDDRSTKYGVTFKVRVAKGKKARKLTYRVTANGARATKQFTIGVAPRPQRYKSLTGRYFWGFATTSATDTKGWDTEVIWFLNRRWAHFGAPRNGVVPKCRRTTKACKKYAYNRRTGVVRIAGRKAKVTTYGFTYTAPKDERRFYEPVTFPRKGQRFATNLINNDWSGNCLLMCTATVSNLTLDRKGRFLRGSFSVGSWPGLGSSWSSIPPDQRGTYRVISRGRVELRYATGKVERTRMALSHNALNRPSATSGIVLGTKNYYHDD